MLHRSEAKHFPVSHSSGRSQISARPLVLQAASVLLVISWLTPPLSTAWQALDQVVFRGLNETLYWGTWWQQAAAIANCRAFDLFSGAVVVILLAIHISRGERLRQRSTWLSSGALVLAMLAGHLVFVDGVVHGALGYHRPSPTLVSPDVLRLSQILPEWPAKDTSPWSFPGDHGYVLLCVALFLTFFSSRGVALAAWLAAVVFCTPRLVSGAHWLSDIAVGSLALSMLSISALLLPVVHDRLFPHSPGRSSVGSHSASRELRQRAA